jgi:hypothetical protein
MSGDGERREQAVTGLYVATVYGLTVNPGPGCYLILGLNNSGYVSRRVTHESHL